MDGNGRWARRRGLPRTLGHARGAQAVRSIVEACAERGVAYLTLFAFSSENWRRPAHEVSALMSLFVRYLKKELNAMNAKGVRLKVIGDISAFSAPLQHLILQAQAVTAGNSRITLTVAANYGGRWDVLQAVKAWQTAQPDTASSPEGATEASLAPYMSMAFAPDPDLLIRTGGESRISNFLLWQMAYTELYFTDLLWPDFEPAALDEALRWYQLKDRRFGGLTQELASEATS